LGLALDFEVNENPGFLTVVSPNFDEFIGFSQADFGFADDLLEFGVEEFVAPRPVNVGVDGGEAEGDKGLKVKGEGFFPRVIVIGSRFARVVTL
jgi:hypothetical protein